MSAPLGPARVEALLSTRWLGSQGRYRYLAEVGSTNDEVAGLARAGEPHGTVLAADVQTSGRGRLGRPWHSPGGDNLYLSVLLRPALLASAAPPLSLAAAVAVADGITAQTDGRARPVVKWPNDLLLGGRKVAGILIELSAERDRIRHVVLGLGVNVNGAARDLPAALRSTATSLAEHLGAPLDRAALLAAVLAALESRVDALVADGPAGVIRDWQGYADWLGQSVTVRTGQGEVAGVALGLDPTGALLLRDRRGRELAILAGDVSLVGEVCPPGVNPADVGPR